MSVAWDDLKPVEPSATSNAAQPSARPERSASGPPSWDDLKPIADAPAPAPAPAQGPSLLRRVGDAGVSLAEGALSAGLAIPQLANTLTGGAVDRYLFKPATAAVDRALGGHGVGSTLAEASQDTRAALDTLKSPQLQREQQGLQDTKGFLPTAGYLLRHPALAANQFIEQVPQFIAPAGVTRKAGQIALERVAGSALERGIAKRLAAGMTEDAARAAATPAAQRLGQRAAIRAGAVADRLSEAAISAGQNSEQAQQDVMGMDQSVLDANPDYQAMVAQGATPQEAREALAQQAARRAAAVAGALTAATGGITSKLESRLLQGQLAHATPLLSRPGLRAAATTVGKEAAQETLQEGGEQFGENVGVQSVDPNRSLMEGVPENAAIGGVIGGLSGGALHVGTTAVRTRLQHPRFAGATPGSLSDAANTIDAAGPISRAAAAAPTTQPPAAAPRAAEQTPALQAAKAEFDTTMRASANQGVNATRLAQEIAAKHGVSADDLLHTPDVPAKPASANPVDPGAPPWMDPASGEIQPPTKDQLVQALADHIVRQHGATGDMRISTPAIAQAWGVPKGDVDRARNKATKLASDQVAAAERAAMSNAGAGPQPDNAAAQPDKSASPVDKQGSELDAASEQGTTASIPVMITQAMKRELRTLGHTDADIAKMTPQQAHDTLRAGEQLLQPSRELTGEQGGAAVDQAVQEQQAQEDSRGAEADRGTEAAAPAGASAPAAGEAAAQPVADAGRAPGAGEPAPAAGVDLAGAGTDANAQPALTNGAAPAPEADSLAQQSEFTTQGPRTTLRSQKLLDEARSNPPAAPSSLAERVQELYRAAHAESHGHELKGRIATAESLARAIEQRDPEALRGLNIGDAKSNPAMRRVFEQVTGVTLPKGKSASLQAIDAWAGLTPEDRARRESDKQAARDARNQASHDEAARKRAEGLRVKTPEGEVNGRAHIDQLVAQGYNRVESTRAGDKMVHRLVNAAGESEPIKARQLKYAKEATAGAAPATVKESLTAGQKRTQELLGAGEGDTIRTTGDGADIKAGSTWKIERIDRDGTVHISSPLGGSGSFKRGELEREVKKGASFEKSKPQPATVRESRKVATASPEAAGDTELSRREVPQYNPMRPAEQITSTLYRETNPEGAAELLDGMSGHAGLAQNTVYAASHEHLAQGQGNNRGVVVELDPAGFDGRLNLNKPAARQLISSAGQAELEITPKAKTHSSAFIRSVTLKPRWKAGQSAAYANRVLLRLRQLEEKGWTKEKTEAGIVYRPPAMATGKEPLQVAPAAEQATPVPLAEKVEAAADEAATSPNNDLPEPTDAQKEAGVYKMGHVWVQGLDISIENPRGSTRSGVGENGKPWSHVMSDHYGYVRGTRGADGDHVDVYVGPNPESQRVFVVDQLDQKTGAFDEHKSLVGFGSEDEAVKAYRSNFDKGWKVGPVHAMSMDEFKTWLKEGDTSRPIGEHVAAEQEATATADAAPPEPTGKIEDLGEKIGGARKDTAAPTGARGSQKAKDDRPAWAKRWVPLQDVRSKKWLIVDQRTGSPVRAGSFDSMEAAEKAVPMYAVSVNHRASPVSEGNWALVRDVTDRKRVTLKEGFPSREAVMQYMAEHAGEILGQKTGVGEEVLAKPEKVMRTGEPRRTGDVAGQDFMDTFGFRGVEFGNWNNQAERQEVMNHAFDGLHDLAEVIGVPPRALSLNGELALAFGARGQGVHGARAHYERDYGVMNLTKMQGAGALAHEWFHALDHYLGRQDGKASSKKVTNARGDQVFETKGREHDYLSHSHSLRSKVRPELVKEWHGLIDTMFRKAEQYVRDTEQAEKFVHRARDTMTKALDDLRNDLARELTYGSRRKPATPEQLAEFDKLTEPMRDGQGLDTEWRAIPGSRQAIAGRYTNDILESLNGLLKAVRNRQGFNAERRGTLDRLRVDMQHYAQRIKMLEEARAGDQQTKHVPTRYAMDAKAIDQGRASDYWTTQHEMAARAFSAYVEDKLGAAGRRSDFLSYGSDNKFYVLDGIRPFPEGEERKAIDAAFDRFFGELKTENGENGNVRLFSFAGERARTADRAALEQAKAMEAMGRDSVPDRFGNQAGSPEETHVATGWQRGVDGKWRFEIDDSQATVDADGLRIARQRGQTAKLGDVLSHRELLAAYPDLGGVQVRVNPDMKGLGSYSAGANTIEIRPPSDYRPTGDASLKSVLLHEIQHAIQAHEGFARGGSAKEARTLPEFEQTLRQYMAEHNDALPSWTVVQPGPDQLEQKAAQEVYRRLAGEVEARNTQRRANMTAEDRRASPPSETADVPRAEQIVRFNASRADDMRSAAPTAEQEAHAARVRRVAAEAIMGWNGDDVPALRVVATPEQLPPIAKVDEAGRPDDSYLRANGMYDGHAIWIVASAHQLNPAGRQQILTTLAHEGVGHYGIDRIVQRELGAEAWNTIEGAFDRLRAEKGAGSAGMRQVLADLDRRYGTDVSPATYAREGLALMAERGVRNGLLDRAVTALRRWLRKVLPNLKLSEAELRQLLVKSQEYLERGPTYAERVQAVQAMAFSREAATAPEAFQPDQADAERFRRDLRRTVASLRTNEPPIRVSGMPPVLRALGGRDVPIVMSRDVVRKATNGVKHDVPLSAIERLPEELHDPLAVFRSATQGDSLVVLTEERDASGRPVIAALDLRPTDKSYDVTRIASVYGKGGDTPFQRWASDGLLAYKSERAESSPVLKGLQLPDSVPGENGPAQVLSEKDVGSTYAKMAVQPAILGQVRERFGRIEGWWRRHFGYGFDGLTQSEARTILTYDKGRLSPDSLRDRVLAKRIPGLRGVGEAATGDRPGTEAPGAAGREGSDFSLSPAGQTDTPAFKRWFGNSKVVDRNGAPRAVYHGTAEDFDAFDPGRSGSATAHMTATLGTFFAEDRSKAQHYAENASQGVPADERIVDAYLSIQRPYVMGLKQFMGIDSQEEATALRKRLASEGYDGIHLKDVGQWVAFRPEQIKSASANRGTFDPTDPRIDFSLDDRGNEVSADKPAEPFSQSAASVETINASMKHVERSALQQAKDWIAGKAEDVKPMALGWLHLRHVAELAQSVPSIASGAKHYINQQNRMQALRHAMEEEGGKKAESLRDFAYERGPAGWLGKLKPQAKALFAFQHKVTQLGIDPANPYERLLMPDSRGEMHPWTEEMRRERIKALLEQQRGRPGDDKTAMQEEVKTLRRLPKLERARQAKYPQLVAEWNRLSPEAKDMFVMMRDYYQDMGERMLEANVAQVRANRLLPEGKKRVLEQHLRDRFAQAKGNGVYFPLGRFGDYWISGRRADTVDAQGNVQPGEYFHMRFENAEAQRRQERLLLANGASIEASGRADGQYQASKAPPGSFVSSVIDTLREAGASESVLDKVYQDYLKTMPELALAKHFIHRKNIAGYTDDVPRVFANHVQHAAIQIARATYAHELGNAMAEMEESLDAARRGGTPAASHTDFRGFMDAVITRYESDPQAELAAAKAGTSVRIDADEIAEHVKERADLVGSDPKAEQESRRTLAERYNALPSVVRERYAPQAREMFGTATPPEEGSVAATAHADALVAEMGRRHEWLMNPTDSKWANQLNALSYLYFLGASPASALVNLVQVPQIVLPVLGARHGWGKAASVLAKSMREAVVTRGNMDKRLTGDELKAYQQLHESGTFQRTQTHMLAGMASGDAMRANPALAKVMHALSWMFQTSEVINRTGTGMAAYRLGRLQGMSHAAALKYADEMTNGTHGDYSNANRSRYMQHGAVKVATQFKSYGIAMSWLWGREMYKAFKGETPEVRSLARKTLTGLVGMTSLFAGVTGLPMINALKFVAQATHAVAGDDDEPWDFDTEFRNWLAQWLGDEGAGLVASGAANQVLGINLSSRVGQANLFFHDDNRQMSNLEAVEDMMVSMFGPLGGIAQSGARGLDQIDKGHVSRGVETMMPSAVKNAMKSYRYVTQGVNTLEGAPIVDDVSGMDGFRQLIGFQPLRVADQQRENSVLYGAKAFVLQRRSALENAYALAYAHGDTDDLDDAREAIAAFNRRWPQYPIRQSDLRASLRGRARSLAESEHGVRLSGRLGAALRAHMQAETVED